MLYRLTWIVKWALRNYVKYDVAYKQEQKSGLPPIYPLNTPVLFIGDSTISLSVFIP